MLLEWSKHSSANVFFLYMYVEILYVETSRYFSDFSPNVFYKNP